MLLFVLILLNLGWVLAVDWAVKRLPKSDRIEFYGIVISGPVGWIIFAIMVSVKVFRNLCESGSSQHSDSDMDELEQALMEAKRNGSLDRPKEPDFDDPDFDWESYESFKNLK